jgi:prepilin-type N-terminal cleavage/methylation domain-containing protein
VRRHEYGHSLLELLIALAILGLMVCVAVPAFATYRRKNSIIVAARQLEATLRLVRSRSIARSAHAGIKFTGSGSSWSFAIYDDGDDDGVRNDDIRNGTDPMAVPPAPLMPRLQCARIGLLPYAIKDPDGDPLPPAKSPVQFGTSAICSFSPIGSGTPGTIYVTTDIGDLYCIRVLGTSGRVRILRYGANKTWEETR